MNAEKRARQSQLAHDLLLAVVAGREDPVLVPLFRAAEVAPSTRTAGAVTAIASALSAIALGLACAVRALIRRIAAVHDRVALLGRGDARAVVALELVRGAAPGASLARGTTASSSTAEAGAHACRSATRHASGRVTRRGGRSAGSSATARGSARA